MPLFQHTRKKGAVRRLFLSAWLVSLLALAGTCNANPGCTAAEFDDTAVVLNVHDGDTVTLDGGRKLRLIGIDTPELARGQQAAQAFALAARDYLRSRMKQHNNRVGLVFDEQRRDKYNRTLAHLYFENGESVQAALLDAGLAVAFSTPPDVAGTDCYRAAEAEARAAGKNIWSIDKYRSTEVSALADNSDGFHIVRGRVLQSRASNKDWWIDLEGGLGVQIKSTDLDNFDVSKLSSLAHKTIEIRGWLHPKHKPGGNRFYLQLRHPDNFSVH